MSRRPDPHVLFVANFQPGVGYAWQTIERVLATLGNRLSAAGVRTSTCFPEPAIGLIAEDATAGATPRGLLRFLRFLRRSGATVLYLTDQASWSWRYPLFRLAGVTAIVVHDRTSGARRRGGPLWRSLKRWAHRVPGLAADRLIGISRFVTDRLREVNGAPAERIRLVYNGIDVDRFGAPRDAALRTLLGVRPDTPVVFTSSRAQAYKGIPVLIEAAARLAAGGRDVAFAYCGDGPALEDLRRLAAARGVTNFHFLGRRDDVPDLLGAATVAAVPAVWAEAFGLSVVEAMAAGVPVVASRTGAIPELIADGETGLLVPPGDAPALAEALGRLLDDPPLRTRLATSARAVVRSRFTVEGTVAGLYAVLAELLPTLRGAT
jgi:glycosyltransferase involved in cell wall biosynthesis